MITLHLVGLNDGTDEIYNLQPHSITIHEGQPIGDAWQSWLEKDWEEWADTGSFDDDEEASGFDRYREWRDNQFWLVSLVDLSDVCDLQNSQTSDPLLSGGSFKPLEEALKIMAALSRVLINIATDADS